MKSILRVASAAILICSAFVFACAQNATASSEVLLIVSGEVSKQLKVTRADWNKFARKSITAKDHDGKEHPYEGVALADILEQAGVKFGDGLRGKTLATYLLVEAADKYQAVFALPEFDAPSSDRLILLADRQDGGALPAADGPLKIIAPGDSRHSRWVRQVRLLQIVRAPAPGGKS